MGYQVIKKGQVFKIRNNQTGKLHKNTFKTRANAETQLRNRLRFQKLMAKNSRIKK